MPKIVISANKRVKEFPNQNLESRNGKLWCNPCSVEVDYLKKSTIEVHLKSSKHRKSVQSLNQALVGQPRIDDIAPTQSRWA